MHLCKSWQRQAQHGNIGRLELTKAGDAIALLQHIQRSTGCVLDVVCKVIAADGEWRVGVVEVVQAMHLDSSKDWPSQATELSAWQTPVGTFAIILLSSCDVT